MIEINKTQTYINVFDNITELCRYVTTKPRKPGRDSSSDETGNYSFYGTYNFEEAINKLKYGDEELFKKTKEEKNNLKIDQLLGNARKRQTYFNNIVGVIPNVPNYLLNIPNNMIDLHKVKTSQKIINIFLNIRVSAVTEGSEIVKIGSKYLSIIDLLEKNGYRCNLYSGVANSSGFNKCCMMVKIKTDREPLNIKKICFTIANPSMQRRIKFRWMEVNDGAYDFTDGGYGGAMDNGSIKSMLHDIFKEDFIIWGYEDNNKSKSIETLVKDLEKAGIKLNAE